MTAHRFQTDHDIAWDKDTIKDPDDAGTIKVTKSGLCELISGSGAETRTLPVPTAKGIILMLVMGTDGGGDITVTATSGYNSVGTTTLVFADVGDMVRLVASPISTTAFRWRLVAADGVEIVSPSDISAIILDDGSTMTFGTGSDVEMQWDGTTFNMAPASGFWADCPMVNWPGGHTTAVEFFDHFLDFSLGAATSRWTAGTNTGGTVDLGDAAESNTPGIGGFISLSVAGANQYDFATIKATATATGAPFKITENSGKKLWWEANITVGTVTDCYFMLGLMDPAADDITVDATGAEAVQDGFYFRTLLATETQLDTATNQNTTETEIGGNVGTIAANGNYTLGMKFDGVTTLTFYLDGTALGDTVTIGDSGNIPNDVGLTTVIHAKDGTAGGTADDLLHVDWVKVVQLI